MDYRATVLDLLDDWHATASSSEQSKRVSTQVLNTLIGFLIEDPFWTLTNMSAVDKALLIELTKRFGE